MSQQPFQCDVCHGRFTRNENLKRHAALHSRSPEGPPLSCEYCAATFSRADLRRRHMKKRHPEQEERRATKRRRRGPSPSTSGSEAPKSPQPDRGLIESAAGSRHGLVSLQSGRDEPLEMDGGQAWRNTSRYGDYQFGHGRQHHGDEDGGTLANTVTSTTEDDGSQVEAPSLSHRSSTSRSTHMDRHTPDATDIAQSLLLGASLLKPAHHLGVQIHPATASASYAYEADHPSSHFNHGIMDSLPCKDLPRFQEDWTPSATQITRGVCLYFDNVSPFVPFLHRPTFDVAQTPDYLVLSMLSLAYQHGEDPDSGHAIDSGVSLSARCFHRARLLLTSREEKIEDWTCSLAMTRAYLLLQLCAMMYLCGDDSAHGLQMHYKMILLARSERLMQPIPTSPAASEDLEALWRDFVDIESHKRTLFAVHQIDALWYQLLSIPRSLSHLEFKHELPCPDDSWTAISASQWAHRRLLARHSGPPVQYGDAIRHFLSAEPDMDSLPAFDPYGTVNIAQFLISSAREITGWSTMTGRLCIERFEPLRSSLEALRPFIRPRDATARATHPALYEATWEMAMIELQMWSPAHTGGIVGGSMAAMLEQSTQLTPSWEFLVETDIAKAVQPHVDWFLRYLDTTLDPGSEPPWVALYAYKAFLIAWQLVRGGSLGAMQAVGVDDGDVEGAVAWARKVFGRRRRRQLGKVIMTCLDVLGK